jgi:hypothetical protein
MAMSVVGLVLVHVSAPAATEAVARFAVRFIVAKSSVATIMDGWQCAVSVDATAARPPNCIDNEHTIRSASLTTNEAEQMRPYFQVMEGEYQLSWQTLLGINLKGWLLAPLRLFSLGGSNPLETGVKNLRGIPGSLGVIAKLENGLLAAAFTAYFLPEATLRDKLVAEAIPCARGAIGSGFRTPIAGNLCTIVLFHKHTAAELTPAERCYWAASAKRLVRVVGPDTPLEVANYAAAVAKQIRARADNCILRMGARLGWTRVEIQERRAALMQIAVAGSSRIRAQ